MSIKRNWMYTLIGLTAVTSCWSNVYLGVIYTTLAIVSLMYWENQFKNAKLARDKAQESQDASKARHE